MFNKKTMIRWGISLAILFVGLGMLYNYYRNSQPLKPVIVYKYTEPPARPLKSGQTESKSKQTTASDSESELEPVETWLPKCHKTMPRLRCPLN